ncbi:MAG TPA: hemerythrin domain-containing protein [Terriglobales bacterium]|nr:hemerythrin domain-containing protein [Terriglobales bacterium]
MAWQSSNRSIGRDMEVVAGGLAAGVLGSRLLPPMLAMANGSMRVRLGQGPLDRLLDDHRQILTLLGQMREAYDVSVGRRTAMFLSLKRLLAKHALAEEDVVYPVLHGKVGAAEAAKRLYDEHADMKIHLYELEASLHDATDWTARVRWLHDLVERHIRAEETVEFPRLHAFMEGREGRTTASQIHREEAMIL